VVHQNHHHQILHRLYRHDHCLCCRRLARHGLHDLSRSRCRRHHEHRYWQMDVRRMLPRIFLGFSKRQTYPDSNRCLERRLPALAVLPSFPLQVGRRAATPSAVLPAATAAAGAYCPGPSADDCCSCLCLAWTRTPLKLDASLWLSSFIFKSD